LARGSRAPDTTRGLNPVMGARLGANQYGKAEVRIVKVTRDTARHAIEDLNVTSQLRGDFTATHLTGDNALVVATDTQKNTVYGLAREQGIGSPEDFLLLLGRHFTGSFDWVTGGRWAAEQYFWDRIDDHDHAFVRDGGETRTAVLTIQDGLETIVSGLTDLVVLKSTGSEFHGFPRDRFTTLTETDERILATAVTATWTYTSTELDFNALYSAIRARMLRVFADTHSLALQQTLYAMGAAVIEDHEAVAEVTLSMPNKHHFLVDLKPFELDNPNEIFFPADRPYGLIEATVLRDD
jgi:urate oxidase